LFEKITQWYMKINWTNLKLLLNIYLSLTM
jgi:hypothetical protein